MRLAKQAMSEEQPIQRLIQKAYENLKTSDAASAIMALEEALRIDYENPEVVYALKCIQWWLDRIKGAEGGVQGSTHLKQSDTYARGEFILSQWDAFYGFLDRIGEGDSSEYDPCHYAIKRFVFSTALQSFEDILGDGINQHDPELLLRVGRCYKGVGNYEEALKYLEQAVRFKREDGEALSQLADVNALMEETRSAKALFREAFFMDAQKVDIRSMESEMILRLRDRVKAQGYTGRELLEWIPIYGCLYGIFSVKRELKQVELGRLKQSIFTLENAIRGKPEDLDLLIPRLINRYFWLIDHYENVQEDPALIAETLLKIKIYDPAIYERYIG
ncbi:tetratricopeptide repeat protein [Treponema primitia]|uniref:tetratricopeptide repeat protein n=1 Tax=Treponema primitia TaxID=88058 RepID=UPI00397F92C0